MNDNLRTVIIAPMNSTSRKYPTRVKVKHNSQEGWVVIDQIRTIDKIRIIKKFGSLTDKEIRECKRVMRETFID
jgi:mRNA interferase MazF